MSLIDAILGRRAVRDYTDQAVAETVIAELIEAAVQAPNSMNRQSWSFVVVTDRRVLARIAREAKAHMFASVEQSPGPGHVTEHLAAPEFDIFYGAPALVVICATAPDEMATYDCCLAAENLMLAAHAGGLGSCWIGFAEGWLREPEGKAALGLPDQARVVAPIILGHPRSRPQSPGRRSPEVRWIRS
ncbi:MAG: nitroreductase family protein [Caulobacterales bacterium]